MLSCRRPFRRHPSVRPSPSTVPDATAFPPASPPKASTSSLAISLSPSPLPSLRTAGQERTLLGLFRSLCRRSHSPSFSPPSVAGPFLLTPPWFLAWLSIKEFRSRDGSALPISLACGIGGKDEERGTGGALAGELGRLNEGGGRKMRRKGGKGGTREREKIGTL